MLPSRFIIAIVRMVLMPHFIIKNTVWSIYHNYYKAATHSIRFPSPRQ